MPATMMSAWSRPSLRAMITRCCGPPRCQLSELLIAPATTLAPFGPGFVWAAPRSRRFAPSRERVLLP